MTIRNGDGDDDSPYKDNVVVFVLSRREAERVVIDHGEGTILLPCADTIAGVMAMAAALRGDLTDINGYAIEPIPD